MTISLPDELAEKVKRAAGGQRRISSYVVAALQDYMEREDLQAILAAWKAETSVPERVRCQIQDELGGLGLNG